MTAGDHLAGVPMIPDRTGTGPAWMLDGLRHRLGTYWSLQLAGWATYALIAAVTLMPMFPAAMTPRLFVIKGIRGALGLPCSDLLRRLYTLLERRSAAPWIWALTVSAAHIALGTTWYLLFFVATSPWQPANAPRFQWAQAPHNSIDSVLVLATWSALYFAIAHWQRARRAQDLASEAAQRADRAQLAALQYQLNPHFLFNALNSIRWSIIEEPTKARDSLTRLADLLRQTVYAPRTEWTPLGEEVEWARNYLALEQLRFEDRLETCLEIEEGAAACLIPSFLLHPLVENAIKHGIRTSPAHLAVRVQAFRRDQGVEIRVANTGRLASANDTEPAPDLRLTHGVGIANLRKRLTLLDPARNRFELVQDGPWVQASVFVTQPSTLPQR
jgi:hypothetical protein